MGRRGNAELFPSHQGAPSARARHLLQALARALFAHSQPPNRFLRKEKIRKACGGGSSQVFRVFLMTIINKNGTNDIVKCLGVPVTSCSPGRVCAEDLDNLVERFFSLDSYA